MTDTFTLSAETQTVLYRVDGRATVEVVRGHSGWLVRTVHPDAPKTTIEAATEDEAATIAVKVAGAAAEYLRAVAAAKEQWSEFTRALNGVV